MQHAEPIHPATCAAVGAESQAELQVAEWQVTWELVQLQTSLSLLFDFIILNVLGKSAFWETIQGVL